MASKSQPALIVAAVAVGGAALLGIAAIEGWLSWPEAPPTPTASAHPGQAAVGIAPVESLSPGETVVTDGIRGRSPNSEVRATSPNSAPSPSPAPLPAASAEAPKPAPKTPVYAQAAPKPRATHKPACPNCGVVASTTWHEREGYFGRQFEVRVRFDDGSRKVFIFPTDPELATGDRVILSKGRLTRSR